MSSTTDPDGTRPARAPTRLEGGQVLPIFALSLVALLAVAALVFDAGQMLFDRRIIQNGADAAALAGAKYVGACPSPCTPAINAALDVAARNGHVNGTNGETVTVKIPPGPEAGEFAGVQGYLEVVIEKQRPAFFATVLGQGTLQTSAMAVARGSVSGVFPYAFISLNKTTCVPAGGTVGGNNVNIIMGPMHTNSTCEPSFRVAGVNTQLTAPVCTTSGTFSSNSGVPVACTPEEHVSQVEDPLATLPAPPVQPYPADIVGTRSGGVVGAPNGCPGNNPKPSSADYPRGCSLTVVGNQDTTYLLSPGTYYGGLQIQGTTAAAYVTVLFKPGIYYMAGGGFSTGGNGQYHLRSVEADGVTQGGGVLIYNSVDPNYVTQCAADPAFNPHPGDSPTNKPCLGTFNLTGSAGGTIWFKQAEFDPYRGLYLFQDRTVPMPQPVVSVAGYSSNVTMSGTIYAAKAQCIIAGNGTGLSLQWICDIWTLNGNSTITIDYVPDDYIKPAGQDLVK